MNIYVEGLERLGEKYKFKVTREENKIKLAAKNTDGNYTDWIIYDVERDSILYSGNTDNCNIWFCETRKDFTPEIVIDFVKDLNEIFDLKDDERFFVKELIDPEDWQEIAGINNAYDDKRYVS